MKAKLLIATGNTGKLKELCRLLGEVPFEIISPAEAGISINIAETGDTYEENALLKAKAFARVSKLLTLADDSGLEIDALGGKPGIKSARFGGGNLSDQQRNELMLDTLKDVPLAKRTARFKCVIAISDAFGRNEICHGECEGVIALSPAGSKHFGYDPIFYLPQFEKTMAELPAEIKNSVSHRARAVEKARVILENWSRM